MAALAADIHGAQRRHLGHPPLLPFGSTTRPVCMKQTSKGKKYIGNLLSTRFPGNFFIDEIALYNSIIN